MRRLPVLAVICFATAGWSASAGDVELVAGGGSQVGDGISAVGAKITSPFGVEFDAKGNLLVIGYSSALWSIGPDGTLTAICGDGKKGDAGDGGPAKAARLNAPHAIAVGKDGSVFIADTLNHKVRRIDAQTGAISTFAGTTKGYAGDGGPASAARFSGIYSISLNPAKDVMIVTDLDNRRIRKIDLASGIVSLVAGDGSKGVPADGADAKTGPLVDPRAAAMDSNGNVYVLERGGNAMRVVDAGGKIRTAIPKDAVKGPKHLWIDPADDVYVTDTDHHRIVKWLAKERKLIPVAGTGNVGTAGVGGPPEQLQLNQPHGVYLAPDGTLYISDSMNDRVVKVVP